MRNWANFRHNLFFKFSFAFLTVGMIPILVLSAFSLNQFIGQVERHTINNFKQTLLYLSKNVDEMLVKYDDISKSMYYNADGLSGISLQREIDDFGLINKLPIDDFLKTILYNDKHIQNAFFVRSADQLLYHQSKTTKMLDRNEVFPQIHWMHTIAQNPKKMAVILPHIETYYSSTDKVITLARNLIDVSGRVSANPNVLGTLFFDIELDTFKHLFSQVELGKNDQLYIVDNRGYILYSNQADKLSIRYNELMLQRSDEVFVFSEPLPFMDGNIVGLVSKKDLYAPVRKIQTTVFVVAGICLAALLILGVYFSRAFSRPVLDIMRVMMRVESGNLDTSVNYKQKDEMGRLAHSLNRMIERLKLFINDAYVSEIKRKQAELNALKSQIRPHYLYNTLEVIRMSAVSNDDDEVADMIHSLSNQLKYVIDYGEEWVSIRRELEHLRDYFNIIEVRFDRDIELQLDISEEWLLEASILKLTLQPLVENAVQHGIRPKGKGTVLVTVEQDTEQEIAVTVYDNGIGMDDEVLQALKDKLEQTDGPLGKNIGVKNVHDRIVNACGETYGIHIESQALIGTSIRMLFPLKMEGSNNEND